MNGDTAQTATSVAPARIEVKHDLTLEYDYHEWVFLGGREYRDTIGRRNNGGLTPWLIVNCNNPDCSARALVPEQVIAAAVEAVERA